jgi:hypothetical protein
MHIAQFEPLGFCNAPAFRMHRNYPYIMDWVGSGWVQKMAIFIDLQYCTYADILEGEGGVKKFLKNADVIYGWSHTTLDSNGDLVLFDTH